jgi:hypothetical protein
MEKFRVTEGRERPEAKHEDSVDPLHKVDKPETTVYEISEGTATPAEGQDVINLKKITKFWSRKPSAVEAQEDLRHFAQSHRVLTSYCRI